MKQATIAPRTLKLGFVLHGVSAGWGDWRHPEAVTNASTNFGFYKAQAQLAEQARFDFLFVADSVHITPRSSPHYLNRFEPVTILSALAAVTSHIGLVATRQLQRTLYCGATIGLAGSYQRWSGSLERGDFLARWQCPQLWAHRTLCTRCALPPRQ